jgi:hypothetical protein
VNGREEPVNLPSSGPAHCCAMRLASHSHGLNLASECQVQEIAERTVDAHRGGEGGC